MAEPVETVDPQYDIVDFGLESPTGNINSLAVGGSFSYAKRLCAPGTTKAERVDEAIRETDSNTEADQAVTDHKLGITE